MKKGILLVALLFLLVLTLQVSAQSNTWECIEGLPRGSCLDDSRCLSGHRADGSCKFTKPTDSVDEICTGEILGGTGNCIEITSGGGPCNNNGICETGEPCSCDNCQTQNSACVSGGSCGSPSVCNSPGDCINGCPECEDNPKCDGDNNREVCEAAGGEWNDAIANSVKKLGLRPYACCGDDPNNKANDKMLVTLDPDTSFVCEDGSWRDFNGDNSNLDTYECSRSIFKSYNVITSAIDLPSGICQGEVLEGINGDPKLGTTEQVLANGDEWVTAIGSCEIITMDKNGVSHQYIDFDRSGKDPVWAECSADTATAFNIEGGEGSTKFKGGQTFVYPSGSSEHKSTVICGTRDTDQKENKYYCARNSDTGAFEWTLNLDPIKYLEACTAYGFDWTGNFCCSEAEDKSNFDVNPSGFFEAYADPGPFGVCFEQEFYPNGGFFDPSIAVMNGEFVGCHLHPDNDPSLSNCESPVRDGPNTAKGKGDQYSLTTISQWPDPANNPPGWHSYGPDLVPLSNSLDYCSRISLTGTTAVSGGTLFGGGAGDYWCSYEQVWKPVSEITEDRIGGSTLKRAPWLSVCENIADEGPLKAECCTPDTCWNGVECVSPGDPEKGVAIPGVNVPDAEGIGGSTAESSSTTTSQSSTTPSLGSSGRGNDPGAPSSIDLNKVVWIDADVSGWSETVNDLRVSVSGSSIGLQHSGGTSVWPVLNGATGNAWIFVWRNNRWYAGTWEWMRPDQKTKLTENLVHPGAIGGQLSDFSAKPGDRYGFMVSGMARLGERNVQEKSNIAMATWPGNLGGGAATLPARGLDKITGNVVNGLQSASTGEAYYCVFIDENGNADWVGNLDTLDRQEDCELYGNTWTGNYCCSEGDDPQESYNDPGFDVGACYNKKFQPTGTFLTFADNTTTNAVIISNSTHWGCRLQGDQESGYNNPSNDNFIGILDYPDPGGNGQIKGDLILNKEYCEKAFDTSGTELYCSFTEEWLATNNTERDELKRVAWQVGENELPAQCCAMSQCWNGTICTDDQSETLDAEPHMSKFMCINGSWTDSFMRRSRDDTEIGFCPGMDLCLESLATGCVESNYWEGDDFCEEGDWTSRTKLVAEKLLGMAGTKDLKLFCDDKRRSILQPDNTGQTSTFCSLFVDNEVVLGAAIGSSEAQDPLPSFLQDLEQAYVQAYSNTSDFEDFEHNCDNETGGGGEFEQCVDLKLLNVYYDAERQLVLISSDESIVEGTFILKIIQFFKKLIGVEPEVPQLKDFNRLFIEEKSSKLISNVLEDIYSDDKKKFEEFLTVEITNVNVDMQQLIQSLSAEEKTVDNIGDTTIIILREPDDDAWELVSGRIRLQ